MEKIPLTTLRRMWSFIKINPITNCWEWQGATAKGYGIIKLDGRNIKAHRLMYFFFIRSLLPHEWVLHRCDNPLCCNPDHLFHGDAKDNAQDALKKGRLKNYLKKGEENRGAKLTDMKVLWARREHKKGRSVKQLASYLGVSLSTMYDVLLGKTWTHIKEDGEQ